jgi:uncharacterized protein YtpQ (UPF0354 family)
LYLEGGRAVRWLFAIVIGGFLLCAAQAETLAPQAFTETFVQRLKAAWPDIKVTIKGNLLVQAEGPNGRTLDISLANLYPIYRSDPNRLNETIRDYVAKVSPPRGSPTTSVALDRTRIIPLIKDRPWLDEVNSKVRAQAAKDAPLLASEDFNKELVIVYALDDSKRMRFLQADELAGIERDELRTLALENLLRIMPKIQMATNGRFGMMIAGGDYEASLLLYDSIWTDGTVKVKGDIVVAIPTRGMLLVTGSQDRNGLQAMREIVAKNADGPYRLTTALFVYRKGRFVKFGKD